MALNDCRFGERVGEETEKTGKKKPLETLPCLLTSVVSTTAQEAGRAIEMGVSSLSFQLWRESSE